jgi:hypothetical protein
MKTAQYTLAAAAALALTFAVGATEALAKKGGGHGGHGGPGWSGNAPPGWGMGRKTGWDDRRPPGWSKGKKKGWKSERVPPGWMR